MISALQSEMRIGVISNLHLDGSEKLEGIWQKYRLLKSVCIIMHSWNHGDLYPVSETDSPERTIYFSMEK